MMTKYEEHIKELCHSNDIEVVCRRSDFGADLGNRAVIINKDIRSTWTYSTALHEIGHILNESHKYNQVRWKWDWYNKRHQGYVTRYVLDSEFAAWVTAKKLAKWWNLSADKNAVESLFTYIIGYNMFHKEPWSGIPKDDFKWYMGAILTDKDLLKLCAKEMYG